MSNTTESPRSIGLPSGPWRTIDLMTAALIGVTFGVAYWGWNTAYTTLSTPFTGFLGPFIGLLGGPWLIAGVVGGLVVRRPGAALFAEVLAAAVSALIGNEWGAATLISGCLQGLGVEIALAIFLYRRFTWPVAALGGALAALLGFLYEWNAYWQDTTARLQDRLRLLLHAVRRASSPGSAAGSWSARSPRPEPSTRCRPDARQLNGSAPEREPPGRHRDPGRGTDLAPRPAAKPDLLQYGAGHPGR